MYEIDKVVMYNNSDVCIIKDIRSEKFGRERVKYYILTPAYDQKMTIYCPIDKADERLRELITKEEIFAVIESFKTDRSEWIEDDRQRRESFDDTLHSGNHLELLKLINVVNLRRKSGKKNYVSDDKMLKDAERIIGSEFGYVLGIEPNKVYEWIVSQVGEELVSEGITEEEV